MMKEPWVLGSANNGLYYALDKPDAQGVPRLLRSVVSDYTVSFVNSSVPKTNNNALVSMDVQNKAKLWHLKKRHVSFSQLKDILPDITERYCSNDFFCTICPAAKKTKLSFPTSSIKTISPFALH